jgi:hypothetical protein
MVLHALNVAVASPFVAISVAVSIVWNTAFSAFLGLPFIGQIIIVVFVALWIIALIVDNAATNTQRSMTFTACGSLRRARRALAKNGQ